MVNVVTVSTQIFAPCTQRFGPDDSKCSYELRLWRPPTASDDSLQNARSDLKKSLLEKREKKVLVLYCEEQAMVPSSNLQEGLAKSLVQDYYWQMYVLHMLYNLHT